MDAQPPKEYEPSKVEPKWQRWWEERGIYRFDPSREGPTYVIDTPPPYPSGEFHLGTALNWTYMDIVARYKRMRDTTCSFRRAGTATASPPRCRWRGSTG